MSRSIKKFLDDGQAEAKKSAEERSRVAERLYVEEESAQLSNANTTTNNNTANNEFNVSSNSIQRG